MTEWNPFIQGLRRTHVLNGLIRQHKFNSYLEIGVAEGTNFQNITGVETKFGVDPGPSSPATHNMPSDGFFKINRHTYDIIFIDGLHFHEQLYRDIIHSLKILNPGGIVVCHDVNPKTEEIQRRIRSRPCWRGDGWKAWVRLRMNRPDLKMYVMEYPLIKEIDDQYGGDDLGFIRFEGQQTLDIGDMDLSWENFSTHRERWLNIVKDHY